MSNTTLLSIDGIDMSDYATRGLTMTLEPIDLGDLRRDVNGTLHDLTLSQFRKYRATIDCQDHNPPELAGIWRGSEVTVRCIPGLLGALPDDGDIATSTDILELEMMVDSWSVNRDEYGAESGWSLTLLEV